MLHRDCAKGRNEHHVCARWRELNRRRHRLLEAKFSREPPTLTSREAARMATILAEMKRHEPLAWKRQARALQKASALLKSGDLEGSLRAMGFREVGVDV